MKFLEDRLIESVIYPGGHDELFLKTNKSSAELPSIISDALITSLQREVAKTSLKQWLLGFSLLFSCLSGVSVGLISYNTFPAVLMALGISFPPAIFAIVIIISILAGLSYALLIDNTLADLIINERITQWWKKVTDEIKLVHNEPHLFKFALLIIWKAISQIAIKLKNWFIRKEQESRLKYSLRIILSLFVLTFGVLGAAVSGNTVFVQLTSTVFH